MYEAVLNNALNRCVEWIGSENGGVNLFGGASMVVGGVVALVGRWLIAKFSVWRRGDNLPIRDFVKKLLARMDQVAQWTPTTMEASPNTVVYGAASKGKVFVYPTMVKVDGVDIMRTFNCRERNVVKEALVTLLNQMAASKDGKEQQDAAKVLAE